jgi:hypothetical protein
VLNGKRPVETGASGRTTIRLRVSKALLFLSSPRLAGKLLKIEDFHKSGQDIEFSALCLYGSGLLPGVALFND